jgi:hypothetical protein
MSIPAELLARARDRFDLTDPGDQARVYALADSLGERDGLSIEDLRAFAGDAGVPLELRLAAKLAESRAYLSSCDAAMQLGVVFAMWGEHNRLRPRSPDNPNGEDLLCVKLEQLEWATRGTQIRWRLYAVDDGCPEQSARIAAERAAGHPLGARVRVLELAETLPARTGPLAALGSADDSRKAGRSSTAASAPSRTESTRWSTRTRTPRFTWGSSACCCGRISRKEPAWCSATARGRAPCS